MPQNLVITGTREFTVSDDNHNGLKFTALNQAFEFSALRNSTEQIENARHQYELQESDATWIKFLLLKWVSVVTTHGVLQFMTILG
ncbi:MAG: hypothetical protein ACLRPQ_02150 [Streptococcus sp.]